jgi:hypothetical protein
MTMIEYEPLLGEGIEDVVWKALRLAFGKNDTVRFDFYGTGMTIDQNSNPEYVIKSFWFEANADVAATRQEKASAARVKSDADDERDRRIHVDELLNTMTSSFSEGPQAMLRWLEEFRTLQGGDQAERQRVAALKDRGWVPRDAMGLPGSEYQDQEVVARYLIGQFLDYLELGQLPTDMIAPWIATYLEIEEQDRLEGSSHKL